MGPEPLHMATLNFKMTATPLLYFNWWRIFLPKGEQSETTETAEALSKKKSVYYAIEKDKSILYAKWTWYKSNSSRTLP